MGGLIYRTADNSIRTFQVFVSFNRQPRRLGGWANRRTTMSQNPQQNQNPGQHQGDDRQQQQGGQQKPGQQQQGGGQKPGQQTQNPGQGGQHGGGQQGGDRSR